MSFSAILMGQEALTVQCGQQLIEAGHSVVSVVSADTTVVAWAEGAGIDVIAPGPEMQNHLPEAFDWLISAANLSLIPQAVLDRAARGAVNFHDGPLPRYAGLNVPVWAMLNGETSHGVTWHMIEGGVDAGAIVAERRFEISAEDTALSLNAKCFAAGLESFADVIAQLDSTAPQATPQTGEGREMFLRADRPKDAALIDFDQPSASVVRFVRALDHGTYPNPVALAKVCVAGRVYSVSEAAMANGLGPVGQVLDCATEALTVATADGAVRLAGLWSEHGLDGLTEALIGTEVEGALEALSDHYHAASLAEPRHRAVFEAAQPVILALPGTGGGEVTIAGDVEQIIAAAADVCAAIMGGSDPYVAVAVPAVASGYVSGWAPCALADIAAFAQVQNGAGFACDLPRRMPDLTIQCPELAIGQNAPLAGASVTLIPEAGAVRLVADADRMGEAGLRVLADRIEHRLKGATDMPAAELDRVLNQWNQTGADLPDERCVHRLFEAQVRKTPEAVAVCFEDQQLTYAALDARANRVAHVLREMGAAPEARVGVYCDRSVEMLIAALAVLKAGAAYVPLDPTYPAERIAMYIADSGAEIVLCLDRQRDAVTGMGAVPLCVDTDPRIAQASDAVPLTEVGPDNLAYVIYTSGSTGTPKGVMVEHRNVANFFVGMDQRVAHEQGGTWLAVTSLSFDISVLELFYTLARGFKLVIASDAARTLQLASPGRAGSGEMAFSVYYWGNDDGVGRDKYDLLLSGAAFADQNGFCAVWTPERHFHAFGGPYPNPSVTGAAVAAVTKNIGVRAGSCVAPLHHPARIAEEWAVIDNLTNGRAGLAIASGWQPDDFVLRPENTPPQNKPAMIETIEVLRKLWAGTPVPFAKADGTLHEVVTQPRPVSTKLPVWVTTAGNPETWKEAGRIGANVLTHLLGQSIDEVEEKIGLYHQALRESGRDPAEFTVTLMLHTYLGQTREEAKEAAREPMKDYLRSAAGLIKQYAWAFPAFKNLRVRPRRWTLIWARLSRKSLRVSLISPLSAISTIPVCLGLSRMLSRALKG